MNPLRVRVATVTFAGALVFATLVMGAGRSGPTSLENGIFNALNQLRARPASFVPVLEQRRPLYHGNVVEIPGQPNLITREGVRPLDEAIRFLQSNQSRRGRVALSAGLSRAAADHVTDSGRRGLVGHTGSDGSDFGVRLSRYGTWSGEIGEEISYGPDKAQEVIASLLIDDGIPDRGHRKSLLDSAWRFVGIACGPHSRFGMMCVIDFAANYRDR